jgi:hypothetical protein
MAPKENLHFGGSKNGKGVYSETNLVPKMEIRMKCFDCVYSALPFLGRCESGGESSMSRGIPRVPAVLLSLAAASFPAAASTVFFSTGNPDGLIATLSRPASAGKIQTETADDFVLAQPSTISSATFTGLLPIGAPLTNVNDVEIELYHVFPVDSANPPSGHVLTRVNSPSDAEFLALDSNAGQITFTPGILNPNFTVLNTVVNGIHPLPNQFTAGEGPVTGQEVQFNILFTTPFTLPEGHYFFRPEVGLTSGDFLWLSAPKPIVPPGTPIPPGSTDLQTWIRNDDLAPDWSRIGTDITHQGPFNAAFSLSGETAVPEPSSYVPLGISFALIALTYRRQNAKR